MKKNSKNIPLFSGDSGRDYCDAFCAGWNLARCGYALAAIRKIQKESNSHAKGAYKNGMVDGANMRERLFGERK